MSSAYIYPLSLAAISVFVAILEWRWPKRRQQQLRPDLLSDFMHLVFNGHFLGVILFGVATHWILPHVDMWLAGAGLTETLYRNAASQWPVWVQIAVCLVVVDFAQWCVHNLLHRVSFFWGFHKTHHSVKNGEMDWIVSFRFQWTEVVVYKTILYLPLAFFGFGEVAVLTHAIFGTLIGHLNHANLDLDYGPLRYVLNNPNMHIWHHDYEGDARTTVNFGIIFSTWDYLFRTAKVPDHDPPRIGFPGVETYPRNFLAQMGWPLSQFTQGSGHFAAGALGIGLIAGGWLLQKGPTHAQHTPMFGETAATSQPAGTGATPGPGSFGQNEAERTAALAAFGTEAAAAGFHDPQSMVSVKELARALGHPRLVLLDVRPKARFEMGHIPLAQQIYRGDYSTSDEVPGLSMSFDALRRMLSTLGVRSDSVVVAYTDGGPEAYRLWWTLKQVTGLSIRVLDGGLQQWKAHGFGLAEGRGLGVKSHDLALEAPARPHRPSWAAIDAFLKRHEDAVLIDTRSKAEFDGEKHHKKAARPGHIPGARYMPWYAIVRDTETDYRLSVPGDLARRFEALGVTPKAPVVTYCQSGTRSAGVYYALHQLGWPPDRLMNYDGSWAEYSRMTDMPVE
ncbi:MAG: rhodanese-like domain-containing protein [Bradymonadia bacterium]